MGLAPYGEPRYRGPDPREADRPEGRRILPDGHVLLQLLPGPDDDLGASSTTSSAGRRAIPSSELDAARDGHRRVASRRSPRRSCCAWRGTSTEATGLTNLCLAGGVALNCVGNGRILREGPFENVWIQPAAGDAGGALGVALFVWHQLLDNARLPSRRRTGSSARCSAPRYGDEEIETFLRRGGRVVPAHRGRGRARATTSPSARRREGRRLVPGPHGVRPARAGRPQHPRRPAGARACSRSST